jgi:hypothetical protein
MIKAGFRAFAAAGVLAGALAAGPAQAADDPVGELANAICAAPDLNAITAAIATLGAEDALAAEQVAEAFGVATFLGDLGRCANRQAIADGFVFFKKGKDIALLDAAFAAGRVAAKPGGGGTASAEVYQGSFASLGTAGDPPSGQ